MSAHKISTKHGYVVVWKEEYDVKPLKCFGDYQSAAIEFCNILNNKFLEKKYSQISMWAASFKPEDKYTYPEFKKSGVELRKQKL